jgi:hypothetical protein
VAEQHRQIAVASLAQQERAFDAFSLERAMTAGEPQRVPAITKRATSGNRRWRANLLMVSPAKPERREKKSF